FGIGCRSYTVRPRITQPSYVLEQLRVSFITEILDFSCCFSESPSKMLRFASFAAKNLESPPHLVTIFHVGKHKH
ncbi:hypothetical protein, partial [Gardnerella vaginalis]